MVITTTAADLMQLSDTSVLTSGSIIKLLIQRGPA